MQIEEQLFDCFQGKTVLITGATGTMGEALARRIQTYGPRSIRLYSRDEYKQFLLRQALGNSSMFRFLIGDVRDYNRLLRAVEGVDIVLHTAAMKHVPICEYNPFEAVQTNVVGTQNMIMACMHHHVERLLVTSSDKAVSPPNTMGATKLLAERLVTSAAYAKGNAPTRFCSVRFGNVIGSRGSVINIFLKNLLQGEPLQVTDPAMTRFMMSIDQAVSLVLQALVLSLGGDLFVMKMPVVKLGDLIQVLLEKYQKKSGRAINEQEAIRIIGKRPGEKMYEELLSEEEGKMALEWEDMFVVLPWWHGNYDYPGAQRFQNGIYTSRDVSPLNKDGLKMLLTNSGILE